MTAANSGKDGAILRFDDLAIGVSAAGPGGGGGAQLTVWRPAEARPILSHVVTTLAYPPTPKSCSMVAEIESLDGPPFTR
jgi:hypothetical protein